MKHFLTLLLFALCSLFSVQADQGMWLPSLISSRIADMQAKGLKLSAEDIYSINQASLKDAVVLFGGGCTGELISDEGLLLTNHHCGYKQIQSHSSLEHDYLTYGFWAMNRAEELPNPGLKVSFLVRMEDVTRQALSGVTDAMPTDQRKEKIAENTKAIIRKATEGTGYRAAVEPFFYGNQYFLFVYEDYTDVRLVGAPPSSIGKFGGDTDNWMWPRHTGDFSVFRIYAGKDNRPAPYSKDNVPFRPRRSFPISTGGVKEGDFTFIYGFPGTTTQYVVSDAVDYLLNKGNPAKIALRTMRLEIMDGEQAKDPVVRIQYAAKNASVANAWKKWQGESLGLARLGTLDKKQALEKRFQNWAADKPAYSQVMNQLHALYTELEPYAYARDLYNEAYGAVELTRFAGTLNSRLTSDRASEIPESEWRDLEDYLRTFYKDYFPVIDQRTARAAFIVYIDNLREQFQPELFITLMNRVNGGEAPADRLFEESLLVSAEKTLNLFGTDRQAFIDAVRKDPAVALAQAFTAIYDEQIRPRYAELTTRINDLYRLYVRGLMEMQPEAVFSPDANLTLRVAYGRVEGYSPRDAVYYLPQSTLDGIIEKDNPEIYDYDIPQRLRDLYAAKDYGRWESNGTVPVAFLATNHTTGGNSGSPVINGNGALIGINFDRTWESTMSDVEFDATKCRNISVDIRYILFVIEKIGGAGYLFKEMLLVD